MRVADPATLTEKLPPALIADWLKYFDHKDKKFDKIEYYLVQLSALIAAIVGTPTDGLIWNRDAGAADDGGSEKKSITPEAAERLLRVAFGV